MRGGPGEAQIELDRRMIGERIKSVAGAAGKGQAPARHAAQGARTSRHLPHLSGGLHQRRQVDAVQCAGQGARAGRRPALRHARHHHTRAVAGRCRNFGVAVGHGGLHPRPAAQAGRGLPGHLAGGRRRRLCCCMWWMRRAPSCWSKAPRSSGCSTRSARPRLRRWWSITSVICWRPPASRGKSWIGWNAPMASVCGACLSAPATAPAWMPCAKCSPTQYGSA